MSLPRIDGSASASTATVLADWIGVAADPRAAEKAARLEARLDLALPDDFRAYLIGAAPESPTDDQHDICWWPIDAVKPVPEEASGRADEPAMARALGGEPEKYLFFADYMGWAYAWAICCSDGPQRGKVVLICTGVEGVVADSFSEFAARAVTNSPDIHLTEQDPDEFAPPEAWLPSPPTARRIGVLEFILYLPLVAIVSGVAALAAIWAANNLR